MAFQETGKDVLSMRKGKYDDRKPGKKTVSLLWGWFPRFLDVVLYSMFLT